MRARTNKQPAAGSERQPHVARESGAMGTQPPSDGQRPSRPAADDSTQCPVVVAPVDGVVNIPAVPTRDGPPRVDSHPLERLAGSYDEEPLWDEFLAAIERHRQEINAAEGSEN